MIQKPGSNELNTKEGKKVFLVWKSFMYYFFFLAFSLTFYTCGFNQLDSDLVEIENNTGQGKNSVESRIIVEWEKYLNCGKNNFFNDTCYSHWIANDLFPYPSLFMDGIGENTKQIAELQPSVLAIFPVGKDTFSLKTGFYSIDKKKINLKSIYTVYAIWDNGSIKFLSSPQWHAQKFQQRKFNTVNYNFPNDHVFDSELAFKLDSFNRQMSFLFKEEIAEFNYFICKNVSDVFYILGFDYCKEKYARNQYGGIIVKYTNTVFAGNNSEYYPHEVVHLYTFHFFLKHGYGHLWFDEGIATLFGGSNGKSLEWHLQETRAYLAKHPNQKLDDLEQLGVLPNGKYSTKYIYSIGGLLCKLIYEKHGMDGLFDVLKSGHTDEDFFNTVERYFGVKKDGFTAFIRRELEKLPEPKN